MLNLSVFFDMFFQHKMRYLEVSEKKNPLFVRGRNRKSVPRDHRLSPLTSLVMPNGDPRDGFFYPTLTLMIDSYILNIDYRLPRWE